RRSSDLPAAIFAELEQKNEFIRYNLFEAISVEKELSLEKCVNQAENFVNDSHFGLEVDLDSIQNIPSSALTPSGFSVNEVRQMVSHFSKNKNILYLHLCEAAPTPNTDQERTIGKLISYLITDFIN